MGSEYAFAVFTFIPCNTYDILPSVFTKEEIVFARTSPKHKLEIGQLLIRCLPLTLLRPLLIVKHAQALGHIVGV